MIYPMTHIRYTQQPGSWQLKAGRHYHLEGEVVVFSDEGRATREHLHSQGERVVSMTAGLRTKALQLYLIDHAAQCPEVAGARGRLVVKHLGRDIGNSATELVHVAVGVFLVLWGIGSAPQQAQDRGNAKRRTLAVPKSVTFKCPSSLSSRLSGLRSRCTTFYTIMNGQ